MLIHCRYGTTRKPPTTLRTVTSPRPLPPGRGPLDEHGRKMGLNDIVTGRTAASTTSRSVKQCITQVFTLTWPSAQVDWYLAYGDENHQLVQNRLAPSLPSATVVAKGNAFTRGGVHIPPGQTPPSLGRHPPHWQTPAPSDGHCSGRYVSYWNAFMFILSNFAEISTFLSVQVSWKSTSTRVLRYWLVKYQWIIQCVLTLCEGDYENDINFDYKQY